MPVNQLITACQCKKHRPLPVELASEKRVSARHYAARFGDYYNVFLNGIKVDQAFECQTGPKGWVARYVYNDDGHNYRCPRSQQTHSLLCYEVLRGEVTVEEILR